MLSQNMPSAYLEPENNGISKAEKAGKASSLNFTDEKASPALNVSDYFFCERRRRRIVRERDHAAEKRNTARVRMMITVRL